MSMNKEIPYKIYLEESEMPKQWYNVRADMKNKPAPLLNPGTLKPMTAQELEGVFCQELIKQELDDTTAYIDIPDEILKFYKMYRPSPLVRAYCLEEKLQTPAKIYYKFEGNNTSGSHKLNSAIAQAYYAKNQGLKGVFHAGTDDIYEYAAFHEELINALHLGTPVFETVMCETPLYQAVLPGRDEIPASCRFRVQDVIRDLAEDWRTQTKTGSTAGTGWQLQEENS